MTTPTTLRRLTAALGAFALVVLGFTASDAAAQSDAGTSVVAAGTYTIDRAHSNIGFQVRHLGISTVKGTFNEADATIIFAADDLSSLQTEATIQAASIDTDNTDRDDHLRSPDFFEVENHPTITFMSREVMANGDGTFALVGDLTMRGVTKEVTLDGEYLGYAKDPWGNEKIGLTAEGVINRKDFGLEWNQVLETGGLLVGEEVTIVLEVQANKQQEEG